MDFTPEDMEAVQTCLEGIGRNLPVAVMPNTVRTVADILNLPTWPAEQLRLVVERWQPAADTQRATGEPLGWQYVLTSARKGLPFRPMNGNFLGPAQRAGSLDLHSIASRCLAKSTWHPRSTFDRVPMPGEIDMAACDQNPSAQIQNLRRAAAPLLARS